MKKIIILLFLFFLCYVCYYTYNTTTNNKLYVTSIGDNLGNIDKISSTLPVKTYNKDFIDKNYRIVDLLNIIKYNQEKTLDGKNISIHQILKKTDILVISIGMNDIYYKLNDNTKEIYTYLNNMVIEYEELLKEVSKYDYKQVYVLGYYNIYNKTNDIFTYINYKIKNLADDYQYTYLNLNNIFYNNQEYLIKNDNFYLNNEGLDQIYKLIVENLKKYWYNIKRIYYYDLY